MISDKSNMKHLRQLCYAGGCVLALQIAIADAQSDAPPTPATNEVVLYRNANLIDTADGRLRPDMDVLIQGERIIDVFPDKEADRGPSATLSARARIVDLRGLYLMPGMIDSHVHLATPPDQHQAGAILRRDIYGGVTAVRDMADDLRAVGELTREALVGEIAAPDIYYASLMGGPKLFSDPRIAQTSVGGELGHVPWMQSVTSDTDIASAVGMARGTYATAIKLYGALTPELAQRLTAEAHRQHLLVWSHATLYPAKPSEVVAAGVDVISHACLLVREVSTGPLDWGVTHTPVDLDSFGKANNQELARVFKEMVRRGITLDATVWTFGPPPPGPSSTPPLSPGSCNDTVGGAITRQAYRAGVAKSTGTDSIAIWSDPWPDLFHE